MKYDVIVIGAGSAGGAIATRLAEDSNRSVLLLEAGPDYQGLEQTPDDLKFGYAPAPRKWARPTTGRSPARAAPPAPRMSSFPADGWSAAPAPSTARCSCAASPRTTTVGPSGATTNGLSSNACPISASWRPIPTSSMTSTATAAPSLSAATSARPGCRCKRRSTSPPWLAATPRSTTTTTPIPPASARCPLNNPNGVRMSTALTYIADNRHRLNFTIRGNVLVKRILFDGNRACGVEVESGGETFTVDADQVVLSAGAVASPQILMLSGVGPAAHLREMGVPVVHDLPGVGQNLRDHPLCAVRVKTRPDFPLDAEAPRIQTVLRYTASGSDLRNDMQILPSSFSTPLGGDPFAEEGIRFTCILELAKSAGEIRLRSTTPGDNPDINCRHLEEEFDRQRMREAIRMSFEFMEHDSFRDIVEEAISPTREEIESDDSLDAWMLETVDIGQHLSGTCKMGSASDSMAVVDQYGRVHGIENLRVADASVMPDVIRANTNLTTIMIGERVADWLIQQTG